MTGWATSPEYTAVRARHASARAKRFEAEVEGRIEALTTTAMRGSAPAALLKRVREGWPQYIFPGYQFGVTVRTEHGWGYLGTGEGFATNRWADTTENWRRHEMLRVLALNGSFSTKTLGGYLAAMLALPRHERFLPGVWALVDEFATAEEAASVRFLYALGGPTGMTGSSLRRVRGLPR